MKNGYLTFAIFSALLSSLYAQTIEITTLDTICSHVVNKDNQGKILTWYKPETPGAGYDHVARLYVRIWDGGEGTVKEPFKISGCMCVSGTAVKAR